MTATLDLVDRLRIGRSIRAIRIRQGWRQLDVAVAAGVSRPFVSNVERGLIRPADIRRVERVCTALGADLDVRVRWRGEGLDLLLDEAHADLVEKAAGLVREAGWEPAFEVTFSEFGERGSIDVLAWHGTTRTALVIEAKSVIGDAQGTLAPLDRKVRLAQTIGQQRGLDVASVGRLLVVFDRTTNRRRIARLGGTFDAAFPTRGRDVRRWLASPSGSMSGLLFLPDATQGSTRRRATGRLRVNRPRRRPEAAA